MSGPWINFAIVIGAASGALTGLLFVAVSLNIARLIEEPALQATAGQTLVVFVLPLLFAILLVIPDQHRWDIGVELMSLGVLAGAAMVAIGRQKQTVGKRQQTRLTQLVGRTSPNVLTSLLIAVAGLSVLVGAGGGLYWLVPGAMIALAGGVANTWLFLTRLPA